MAILLISNTSCLHKAQESRHPCCDHRLQKTDYVDFGASLNTFLLHLMLFKWLQSIFEKLVLHPFPEPLMKDCEIHAKSYPIIGIKIAKLFSIFLILHIHLNVSAQLKKYQIKLMLEKYFFTQKSKVLIYLKKWICENWK